ncbi:hypothetical protein MKEN_00977600 [Mycena kentingensis (nom. inval.)]|nr:hypothetical protein MKEN_00977600 [Mycena kentingensis (nom. inval.)]
MNADVLATLSTALKAAQGQVAELQGRLLQAESRQGSFTVGAGHAGCEARYLGLKGAYEREKAKSEAAAIAMQQKEADLARERAEMGRRIEATKAKFESLVRKSLGEFQAIRAQRDKAEHEKEVLEKALEARGGEIIAVHKELSRAEIQLQEFREISRQIEEQLALGMQHEAWKTAQAKPTRRASHPCPASPSKTTALPAATAPTSEFEDACGDDAAALAAQNVALKKRNAKLEQEIVEVRQRNVHLRSGMLSVAEDVKQVLPVLSPARLLTLKQELHDETQRHNVELKEALALREGQIKDNLRRIAFLESELDLPPSQRSFHNDADTDLVPPPPQLLLLKSRPPVHPNLPKLLGSLPALITGRSIAEDEEETSATHSGRTSDRPLSIATPRCPTWLLSRARDVDHSKETWPEISDTPFLYEPHSAVWCGPERMHALRFSPVMRLVGQHAIWKPNCKGLELVGRRMHYFVHEDERVVYAGVYVVRSLREVCLPGVVVPDLPLRSILRAMGLCRSQSDTRYVERPIEEMLAKVRTLYADGHPRCECFGLECVGFDEDLYQRLRKRFGERVETGAIPPAPGYTAMKRKAVLLGEGGGDEERKVNVNTNANADGSGWVKMARVKSMP